MAFCKCMLESWSKEAFAFSGRFFHFLVENAHRGNIMFNQFNCIISCDYYYLYMYVMWMKRTIFNLRIDIGLSSYPIYFFVFVFGLKAKLQADKKVYQYEEYFFYQFKMEPSHFVIISKLYHINLTSRSDYLHFSCDGFISCFNC